jgi:hypothetical protein
MARYQYNGESTVVFPTLGLTVAPGDVFEADDLTGLPLVSVTKAKVTVEAGSPAPEAPVEAVTEVTVTDSATDTSEAVEDASVDSTTN